MPNYCSNRLTITGEANELTRLKELVKGTDDSSGQIPFDFNRIVPEPKGLANGLGAWAWYE